jgi:hypothetical protein
MSQYKTVLFLLITSAVFQGCQTYKARVVVPAPALREVFRGGAIQGLEDNTGHFLGMPNDYDLVEHTCTSKPIFDFRGRYVKTSVKCW